MLVLAFDEGERVLMSVGVEPGTVGYRDEKDDISMCLFHIPLSLITFD